MEYVKENHKYLKDFKLIEKAENSLNISDEEFQTILNKMSGGSYVDGSLDNVKEGLLGREDMKKMLRGPEQPLGGLSPMTKSSFLIKQLQKGNSVKNAMNKIKKAEARKKLEEEGESKGKGESKEKDGERGFSSDRNGDWKEGSQDDAKYLKVANEYDYMPSPEEILSRIKFVTNKVGFVKRSKKLIEGRGDIIKQTQAREIADMRRAGAELFACPNKTDKARKMAENDYLTKRKYIVENKSPKVIIIEDVSGSMDGERATITSATIIAMMKQEVEEKLEIKDVIIMGEHVTPLKLGEENKVAEYIKKRNKRYDGGFENQKAITQAAEILSREKDAEIIILTDGAFDVKEDMIESVVNTGVKVHALLTIPGEDSEGIRKMCKRSGGSYEVIDELPPEKRQHNNQSRWLYYLGMNEKDTYLRGQQESF